MPSPASTDKPAITPTAAPPVTSSTPSDVTQEAAGGFTTTPGTPAARGDPAAGRGVDSTDPLAVAEAYLARRLTYRFDDPAGYTAALTVPALTTPEFSSRSRPSAPALSRLVTAQETSAVKVGRAELESEAPNSRRTRYVVVPCAVTTTYRGGTSTAPARWTVRLLQGSGDRWRVDGVLSTD